MVAKQCATIDMLSGGRLLPAFGLGSKFSQDYVQPARQLNDGVSVPTRHCIWFPVYGVKMMTFEGEFYQYDQASISPKPANPHIPLWIGGTSDVAVRRTARIGTGWLGVSTRPRM